MVSNVKYNQVCVDWTITFLQSVLTIETGIPEIYQIEIITINGQGILRKMMEGTEIQIDVSSFDSGVYFITLRSKDFVAKRKLIKH